MDGHNFEDRKRAKSPYETASCFSKLLFWWINPLFKLGYKRQLSKDDLYNIIETYSSSHNADILERYWMRETKETKKSGKPPSFARAMIRAYGPTYMKYGVFVFVIEVVKIVEPLLVMRLISYFSGKITETEAFLYAMGLSLCALFLATVQHTYFQGVTCLGMRLRVSSCALMYRKALRLSNTALNKTTVGKIVNLMSNDVARFDLAVLFCHFLWLGPIQSVTVLVLLWIHLGPSCLAGFSVLILLVPLQSYMGKFFSYLRRRTAVQTDERVRLMSEIIDGIRVIKTYCWEKLFGDMIKRVRTEEMKWVLRSNYTKAVNMMPYFISPKLIIFFTFLAYVLSGHVMTAEKAFLVVALYNAIRVSITVFFPYAIQYGAEVNVTCNRIQEFLLLEELDVVVLDRRNSLRPKPPDCGVIVSNVTATWDTTLETPSLKNLSLKVKPGELVAVIGPVGAGKSSLLMTVLGELHTLKGSVTVQGKVGYASQQSWVFTGTVKENILFGQPYDEEYYRQVVKATALEKDISILPNGDETFVGEKGVSLSGGQKARVSLARAMYYNADVYLLDDPLSAVDAAVSKHLFTNCICGMLRHKPRILVTHQLQFLTMADKILILKNGEIVSEGTYNDLAKSGIDFAGLLKEATDGEEAGGDESDTYEDKPMLDLLRSQTELDVIGSMVSIRSMVDGGKPEHVTAVTKEEHRAVGSIGWKVYKDYLAAGTGPFKCIVIVLLNIIAQGLYIAADWWLSYWSRQEELRAANSPLNVSVSTLDNKLYNNSWSSADSTSTTPGTIVINNVTIFDLYTNIYIFTGLTFAVLVFGVIRAVMMYNVAITASRNLHNKMYDCVSKSPVLFFDTNPVGRIQTRFSSDLGRIDELLPTIWFDVIELSLMVFGGVLVAGIVNPWVFIPTVPLTGLFIFIRYYYLCTSRELKRLEATARGPVFSHVTASLNGLYTVRAFGAQDTFVNNFDRYQDLHTEAWHCLLSANSWFGVRLDWVTAGFVASVSFCSVIASKNLDSGMVGLSVTYAIALLGLFQWCVRQTAEVESQMVSVERVLQYCILDSESELESSTDKKPPKEWPNEGCIKVQNTNFSYTVDGPQVLRNLNFVIQSGEKVGIVGRTGAGKSSVIAMLFRLAEPRGDIIIDGVNISQIGLHDLRRRISIIPQDPVLFSGTIRSNLDPFNHNSDESLWRALEEVQLKLSIEELGQGLESKITEDGSNFSIGQRQLICLARAILRRNKILIIDEATANVDPRTDALIQQTKKKKVPTATLR